MEDSTEEAAISGYLFRKTSNNRWQKKYYETHGPVLSTYNSHKTDEPILAALELSTIDEIRKLPDEFDTEFPGMLFSMTYMNKTHTFRATSSEIADTWVDVLTKLHEKTLTTNYTLLSSSEKNEKENTEAFFKFNRSFSTDINTTSSSANSIAPEYSNILAPESLVQDIRASHFELESNTDDINSSTDISTVQHEGLDAVGRSLSNKTVHGEEADSNSSISPGTSNQNTLIYNPTIDESKSINEVKEHNELEISYLNISQDNQTQQQVSVGSVQSTSQEDFSNKAVTANLDTEHSTTISKSSENTLDSGVNVSERLIKDPNSVDENKETNVSLTESVLNDSDERSDQVQSSLQSKEKIDYPSTLVLEINSYEQSKSTVESTILNHEETVPRVNATPVEDKPTFQNDDRSEGHSVRTSEIPSEAAEIKEDTASNTEVVQPTKEKRTRARSIIEMRLLAFASPSSQDASNDPVDSNTDITSNDMKVAGEVKLPSPREDTREEIRTNSSISRRNSQETTDLSRSASKRQSVVSLLSRQIVSKTVVDKTLILPENDASKASEDEEKKQEEVIGDTKESDSYLIETSVPFGTDDDAGITPEAKSNEGKSESSEKSTLVVDVSAQTVAPSDPTDSTKSQPSSDGDSTRICGYLHRKALGDSWQKRYFEATGTSLCYYRTQQGNTGAPLASLDLSEVSAITRISEDKSENSLFSVDHGDKRHIFRAISPENADFWVFELNKIKESVKSTASALAYKASNFSLLSTRSDDNAANIFKEDPSLNQTSALDEIQTFSDTQPLLLAESDPVVSEENDSAPLNRPPIYLAPSSKAVETGDEEKEDEVPEVIVNPTKKKLPLHLALSKYDFLPQTQNDAEESKEEVVSSYYDIYEDQYDYGNQQSYNVPDYSQGMSFYSNQFHSFESDEYYNRVDSPYIPWLQSQYRLNLFNEEEYKRDVDVNLESRLTVQYSMSSTSSGLVLSPPLLRLKSMDRNTEIPDFLFDSIEISFRANIFILHLAMNTFPYVYMLTSNFTAQGFLDFSLSGLLYNHMSNFIFYAMIVSFVFLPTDVDTSKNQKVSDADIIGGAIWIPFTAFLMHRCMIALKWASLSTTEYSKVMRVKTSEQAMRYQMQMQLLTSWQRRDADALCYYEVASAAARAGVDIRSKYIEIKNPELNKTARAQYDNWRLFFTCTRAITSASKHQMDRYLVRQSDGSYRVSMLEAAVSVMKLSNLRIAVHTPAYAFGPFFRMFTYLIILIPLLSFFSQRVSSWWTLLFYASSSVISLLYIPLVLKLLLTKRCDALRRVEEANILREMIRSSDFELNLFRTGEMVSKSLRVAQFALLRAQMKEQQQAITAAGGGAGERGARAKAGTSSASAAGDVEREQRLARSSSHQSTSRQRESSEVKTPNKNINNNKNSSVQSPSQEPEHLSVSTSLSAPLSAPLSPPPKNSLVRNDSQTRVFDERSTLDALYKSPNADDVQFMSNPLAKKKLKSAPSPSVRASPGDRADPEDQGGVSHDLGSASRAAPVALISSPISSNPLIRAKRPAAASEPVQQQPEIQKIQHPQTETETKIEAEIETQTEARTQTQTQTQAPVEAETERDLSSIDLIAQSRPKVKKQVSYADRSFPEPLSLSLSVPAPAHAHAALPSSPSLSSSFSLLPSPTTQRGGSHRSGGSGSGSGRGALLQEHHHHHHHLLSSILDAQSRHVVPMLSLSDSQVNILAWSQLRLLFQHLGERHLTRIDDFLSASAALSALLFAAVAVLVLLSLVHPRPRSLALTYSSPFVLQSIVVLALVSFVVILSSFLSANVNKEFQLHKQSLQGQILKVEERISQTRDLRLVLELERVVHSMKTCEDSLSLYDEVKPYKTFDIKASPALALQISASIGLASVVLIALFACLLSVY